MVICFPYAWENFRMRPPLQHFDLLSHLHPFKQQKCDNKECVNFFVMFCYPIGLKNATSKLQLSSEHLHSMIWGNQ